MVRARAWEERAAPERHAHAHSAQSTATGLSCVRKCARSCARPRVHVCAVDVQHSSVRFLGSLVLNLWDCGGQDVFFDQYFGAKRDHMFTNVSVLIYVFDINSVDAEVRVCMHIRTCGARAPLLATGPGGCYLSG
ncbi:MAG: hypothetical protein EOP08_03030 [Proteobacteria bacterium]|nr:MAG: hypothetical protein EOP08_03030 [Pseudomonadota bacterium]